MRHFSGEFEGVRLLMADELDLIAGGEGEDTDDVPPPPDDNDEEIVVTGRRITMNPVDLPSLPPIIIDLPPDESGAGGLNIGGDPCPTARNELNETLDKLSSGSPTAKLILDAAKDSWINISLIKPGDAVETAMYNNSTKTIYWDPFEAYSGTNLNGSTYTETPIMVLMHELVHWSNPALNESQVMRMTNEIARELNANLGTSFSTGRDSHTAFSEYAVTDAASDQWGGLNGRPGCP